jgi:hypothetical protein
MEPKMPPIQTLGEELTLWTLNHTASFPKSQRHTFGNRIDNLTLDVVERIAEARFVAKAVRAPVLDRLNLDLEKLRVLWRIILAKEWMTEAQARHVHGKINEIGRMAGLWRRASRGDESPPG